MQLKIGEKIRRLRQENGHTQEKLASALGITSQAISRWESGTSYPDMELVPSIANFFGITIDELFGYESEREKRIDSLVIQIQRMNSQNNGVDACIDNCLQLAREAMAEFPGNERIMLCLASVLYNAGYVRHGERHITDEDGYDSYDVKAHLSYPEWQEAVKLYEKLISSLSDGVLRRQATRELTQLYVNTGQSEKAMQLADFAPDLTDCREVIRSYSCDGIKRAEALGETILKLVKVCAELMVQGVIVNKSVLNTGEGADILQNAAALYELVCTDKCYGLYNADLSRIYLYMSEHLWLSGDYDGAFRALDESLERARAFEKISPQPDFRFSSPLLRQVKVNPNGYKDMTLASYLSEDWPWWRDPDCGRVKSEMQKDPRWNEWVKRTKE